MAKPFTIVRHHLVYENLEHRQKERLAYITHGEHNIISKICWHTKNISKDFIVALEMWIALNRNDAVDLRKVYEEREDELQGKKIQ